MQRILDQNHLKQAISTLADKLLADASLRSSPESPLALVGIRSRGEVIAQRLAREIQSRLNTSPIDVGALDITMYRDDLVLRTTGSGKAPRKITIPKGTEMNFPIDDRPVVLCDDVLETGRSVRAALDALVDFGRPRIIRLAILIDRGRREFPIAADYTAMTINPPDPTQKILVHLTPSDPEDAVYLK